MTFRRSARWSRGLGLGVALWVWVGSAAGQAAAPGGTEPGSADLSAASASSPRPRECGPDRGPGAKTEWDRARRPKEQAFCDTLARGYSELNLAPGRAIVAARKAAALRPTSAAPLVLEARALVSDGRAKEAWPVFRRARSIDKRSVEEPSALHDLALSARASGEHDEAVAAYRALVPRAGMLSEPRRRQRVYLEAAMTVMRADARGIDEALGYLGEARRLRGMPGLADIVVGATALALDRQGRSDEARGVAAEARGPEGVLRLAALPSRNEVVSLEEGELAAVAAILAERSQPELAKKNWRAFLDSPAGRAPAWQAHAKHKLESLGVVRRRKLR